MSSEGHRTVAARLILALCMVVMGGCGCSETGIVGDTETTSDTIYDPAIDTSSDTSSEEDASTGTCGNGTIEGAEQCDDGDTDDCNGCSNECRWEMGKMPVLS